jgi:HSP20 family molecular chaperone IbpA
MLDWFESGGFIGERNGVAGWASPPAWSDWVGFACHDTPEALVYTLSVPGYRRKDIEVEVRDGSVIVRGHHGDGVLRTRSKRSFVQSFTLANTLDEQDVRADLRDGVLSVTVAKKAEARARRIPVRVKAPPAPQPGGSARGDDSTASAEHWWKRFGKRIRRGAARIS